MPSKSKSKEKVEIFQFRVELRHSYPLVWRRFQVRSDITFETLHKCLLDLMDWDGDHMYSFTVRDLDIMNPEYQGSLFPRYFIHAHKVKLADQLKRTGIKFSYTYDFGDNWDHDLIFEKRLKLSDNFKFPICIEGENTCPPDDIGGIGAFYNRLEVAKNPEKYPNLDPEWVDRLKNWLGDFELNAFNLDSINAALRGYRSLGEYDKNLVDEALNDAWTPITINDIYSITGIDGTPENFQKIISQVYKKDFLVLNRDRITDAQQILGKFLFRVHPTDLEISQEILIPGQAIIPINLVGERGRMPILEYQFVELITKKIKIPYSKLCSYFKYFTPNQVIGGSIEPGKNPEQETEIKVWDLQPFYKKTHFKRGDSIFIKPLDITNNTFELKFKSRLKNQKKESQIKQASSDFISVLQHVLDSNIPFQSISQQVLYALSQSNPLSWGAPPLPFMDLIEKSPDIKLIQTGKGNKNQASRLLANG